MVYYRARREVILLLGRLREVLRIGKLAQSTKGRIWKRIKSEIDSTVHHIKHP